MMQKLRIAVVTRQAKRISWTKVRSAVLPAGEEEVEAGAGLLKGDSKPPLLKEREKRKFSI